MKKRYTIALPLLLASLATVPYLTGQYAEGVYRDTVSLLDRALRSNMLQAEVAAFEAGYHESTAVTRITLSPGPFSFIEEDGLVFKHHFQHPAWLENGSLASVETVLGSQEGDIGESLNEALFDHTPLRIHTTIGLDGSQHSELNGPALEGGIDSVSYRWQGLTGSIDANRELSLYSAAVQAPGLVVSESGEIFEFGFGGFEQAVELQRGPNDLWLGHSQSSLESMTLQIPELPVGVQLEQANYEERLIPNDELLDQYQLFSAARLVYSGNWGETVIEELHGELMATRLDPEVIATFSHADGDPQATLEVMGRFDELMQQAVSHQPQIVLEQLNATINGSPLEARVILNIIGDWEPDIFSNPRRFLTLFTLQAEIAMGDGLYAALYGQFPTLSTIPGLFVDEEGLHRLSIDYRPGKLTINGQDRPELLQRLRS